MIRSINLINMGPSQQFISCEVNFLRRRNVLWNTMLVDEVFCTSTDGSFGKIIAFREDKSIPRVSDYSSENKILTLL